MMKKILIAAGLLVAATSASWAQGYGYQGYGYYGAPYGAGVYDNRPGVGVYDAAPGYYGPGFGAYSYGGGDWYGYDRVNAPGRGNSAESQR